MFIGHFAVAFGAKKYAPAVSLGTLFLACQLADLVWPNLVLLGVESFRIDPGNTALTPLAFDHYPYSHSLVALALWAAIFAAACLFVGRSGRKAAVIVALVVLSHWVLDVLTHRADMPVTFTGVPLLGLGLWNFPVQAVLMELALFAAGIAFYKKATKAVDRKGSVGLWALVVFLLIVYASNIFAGIFGPPPPSVAAVTWSAQAMWLLVLWGYWVDRHRVSANAPGM